MSNNIIIIMAGGLGKRMNSELPKVLHKIANKPMLVHVINEAQILNPHKILIVVGKYKDIIIETLRYYINIDEHIMFIDQPDALGTGHAIQCCKEELLNYKNYNVIILSGDVPLLTSHTISKCIVDFNKVKIVTTMLDEPYGYGRIIEDNTYLFVKIVEEKDCSTEQKLIKKVNCGIYIFDSSILCKYLSHLSNNNSQKEYYLTDIIEIIKTNEHIVIDTFVVPQEIQYQIIGVNTSEQLIELEKLMLK